jgi:pyruvate kinase
VAATKIVCTIGPACCEFEQLRALIRAGMAVARLNFSHGEIETHREWYARLRAAAEVERAPLAILQDLSGPKIRIGEFAEPRVFLTPGQAFTLTTRAVPGDSDCVSVPLPELTTWARGASRLLLADGVIELKVEDVTETDVSTTVTTGGFLSSHKGLSFAGRPLPVAPLTPKDRTDLAEGLALGVDFVALSFVRRHEDVEELRALMDAAGSHAQIIAKLERPEALDDLPAILATVDGVMIARGDLALELAPEQVPLAQKRILRAALLAGKPVITATQMLESMVHSTLPTRAEASDVANAVLDGTDAVMLSGETATGDHPALVVEMMRRIVCAAETSEFAFHGEPSNPAPESGTAVSAIAWNVAELAEMSGAAAICAFTQSGRTAVLVSKTQPSVPVFGLTPNPQVLRQLNLARGVTPLLTLPATTLTAILAECDRCLLGADLVKRGARVVATAGFPPGPPYHTNLAVVHTVGMFD